MSKIEVDQVTQQSGTTLTVGGGACKTAVVDATTVTLGRCGGTVSLASGATQSGFGRTGTVDWDTASIKTGDFTGASGKGYFVNTTSGTITATLPASPTAGDIVGLKDYALTFDTNSMFIGRNGSPINGATGTTLEISTEGATIMLVYVDGVKGWVPTQDDASALIAVSPTYIAATGGTPCSGTISGDFKIHKFTGPGTFCVSAVGNPAGSDTVDYLIVAGGGGGGSEHGGAGGAGGYRESPGTASGCYAVSPLGVAPAVALPVSATPYAIVIGAGGAGSTSPSFPGVPGADGLVSSFSTITSTGGGKGAGGNPNPPGGPGGSGGGGGGNAPTHTGGTGNTPVVSPAQGTNGGDGNPDNSRGGGAGGGATTVGSAASSCGATGGAGATTSISATPTAYAGGGGGGGCIVGGTGGTGGGGAGGPGGPAPSPARNGFIGTINTGGGGGGGGNNYGYGGNGGSGIIYIRYKFQ